jgi:hypothetical protein
MLSKRFFAIDEFKPYFLEHDRVFWEKDLQLLAMK